MARTSGSSAETTGPRVKEAALKLFAQHGFAAVSMRQIASEVGVQAGALYNYTPDKQSLLFDLMRDHMVGLAAAWEHQKSDESAIAQLERFSRFHIRYHHERQDAVFIAYMELRNLTPENFAIIEKLRGDYEAELVAILERGVQKGDFSIAEPKIAAMALIAMLTGVNTWFREGGRLLLSEVEHVYLNMVKQTVGVSPRV